MATPQVLFEAFPKQEEFIADAMGPDNEVILYGGAIRGGKTWGGGGALVMLCAIYPGSRWVVVRDTLATLKRNTIPSFRKLVPSSFCLKGDFDRSLNSDTHVLRLGNGSEIVFFGENFKEDKELDRWKGLEVNGFLLEEINELQELALWKAIERAGSWIIPGLTKQPKPLVLATCNPTQNWVKQLFYDRWKLGTLPKGWKYIQSRIFDNPFLPEAYKANLKKLPAYQYEVFVLGNWDIQLKTGSEFYKSFALDKHMVTNPINKQGRPELYDPARSLFLAFDENVNPFMTLDIWQAEINDLGGWDCTQIDEICLKDPRNTLTHTINEFHRIYSTHTSGVGVYGDATSRKQDVKQQKGQNFYTLIMSKLQKYKPTLHVPMLNPSVKMRGQWQNQTFENDFNGNRIFIGDNCNHTIADYTNVKEAADGTKLKAKTTDPKTKVRYQEFGHNTDANDYFLCEFLKDSLILYQRGHSIGTRKIVKHKVRSIY